MDINKPPLRVVFMGTPEFAVPCLDALLKNPETANIVGVYSQPDKPAGRGLELKPPPVKTKALEHGLPVYQPVNINKDDEPKKLADLMADVVVVVAYAQFLNRSILSIPRLGCVNVHGSLLPKYRGAAPIQYSLLHGDSETGVSIMKLISKMDAGPVFLQKKINVDSRDTTQTLMKKLSFLGADALIEVLKGLQFGKATETEQDESLVSYAPLIKKEDALIDWNQSTRSIINRIRGFYPWPCAFTHTAKGHLKIIEAQPAQMNPQDLNQKDLTPGTAMLNQGLFLVKTSDGWLDLKTVQSEGKRPMSAQDFVNGIQNSKENFILL